MDNSNRVLMSYVLGSYNRLPYLKVAIDSIRKEIEDSGIKSEIIVVDGGSTDGTVDWIVKQKDVVAIIQHNRGMWKGIKIERRTWGYFMNLGFKAAQGKYVCMLSDDCWLVPGSIKNGIEVADKEIKKGRNVGAVAFYWRSWPEQEKYWVGLTLGRKMFVNHGMYLKKALEEVGYIDEDTYVFYHGDGDLCLKMWNSGYEVIDSKKSFVEHYSHANLGIRKTNYEKQKIDWKNYIKKWDGVFYDKKKPYEGGWITNDQASAQKVPTRLRLEYFKSLPINRLKIVGFKLYKKYIKK